MKRKIRWLTVEEKDRDYFAIRYPHTMMFCLRYMGGYDFFVVELGAKL